MAECRESGLLGINKAVSDIACYFTPQTFSAVNMGKVYPSPNRAAAEKRD